MNSYFLGADVSKGYCDFVILDSHHNTIEKVFQLDDTSHGYRQLHEVLKKVSTNENSRILAGFESTGGYENKWVEAIKTFDASLNIQVARISPTVINASTKTTLQQNKTDKSSAISIAEYLIRFEDVIDFTKDDKWYHLRQQWKYICLLTEQRVALQNYLEKLLLQTNLVNHLLVV